MVPELYVSSGGSVATPITVQQNDGYYWTHFGTEGRLYGQFWALLGDF
jgi:hypothetical protein